MQGSLALVTAWGILLLAFLNCSPKGAGVYDAKQSQFRSARYKCQLNLPASERWQAQACADAQSGIIFEASNPSGLLYLFVAAETLNSNLEDYYLLLKVSNRLEQKPGYEYYGRSSETLQGTPALRFIYASDVEDSAIGRQRFVYVNVLLKNGKTNYRLIVYTLHEAYERKKDLIEQVVKGFRFL